MKFKVGDQVIVPDGREGEVISVSATGYVCTDVGSSGPETSYSHAAPPLWSTSLDEARRLYAAIEAAAEAAHDTYFSVCAEMSDMGYAFQDQRTKRSWREVVSAVLSSVGGQK